MDKVERINQLTSLRFIAALLVFLSHSNWSHSSIFFQNIFSQGFVGVSFFFVLSGFVLSYSYGAKLKNGDLNIKQYLLFRVARLSPLHFMTALPFVLLVMYKGDADLLKILVNIFYIQSWIPSSSYYFSLNSVSWSLSNEMCFYVFFVFFVFFDFKKLVYVTLSLLIIIILSALFLNIYMPDKMIFGSRSFSHWLFYIFPGFRLLEFLTGMVLYKFYKKGMSLPKGCIFLSYIVLFYAMHIGVTVPETFRMSVFYLPFISFFLYSHLNNTSLIIKFLSNKVLILLGEASFAFYLIHLPLLAILKKLYNNYFDNFSDTFFFFNSLFLISILSVLVYLIYEKKAEAFLKRLIRKYYMKDKLNSRAV